MLQALRRLLGLVPPEPRIPLHERPEWDSFRVEDHEMVRTGPSDWRCRNCGSKIGYAHGHSPCPDDWNLRSGVDGRPFRTCEEELALIVLGS